MAERFEWEPSDIHSSTNRRTITVEQTCGHRTAWDIDDRVDEEEFRRTLESIPCQRCTTARETKWYESYADQEQ